MSNDRYPPGSATSPSAMLSNDERAIARNPDTGRWSWTCKLCPGRRSGGFSSASAAVDNHRVYHAHEKDHVAAQSEHRRRVRAGEAASA